MAILVHRIRLEWDGPGSPGVNTWHGNYDEVAASSPQAQVDGLRDFYTDLIGGYWPGMKVTHDGNPFAVDTLEEFPVTGWSLTASGVQARLPAASMMVVSWSTGLRARRGMGRTFIGPLTRDTDAGDGTPLDSFVTGMQTAARTLVTASDGWIGNSLGVWGFRDAKPRGLPRNPADPKEYRAFTGAKVSDQYAVLRSRRD